MNQFHNRFGGFTLIELMIVAAVVAILVGVALPAYQVQVMTAKRSMGKVELMSVLARQEQYFISHRRYATTLDSLGYSANPYAINASGDRVDINSPQRIYLMSIDEALPAAAPTSFVLRAIPQLAQVKDKRCGVLEVRSTGERAASAGTTDDCW
jgi:type IV pilus assembly protein PilE